MLLLSKEDFLLPFLLLPYTDIASNFNNVKTMRLLVHGGLFWCFRNPPNSWHGLQCICDLFAYVYTWGTSVYSLIWRMWVCINPCATWPNEGYCHVCTSVGLQELKQSLTQPLLGVDPHKLLTLCDALDRSATIPSSCCAYMRVLFHSPWMKTAASTSTGYVRRQNNSMQTVA